MCRTLILCFIIGFSSAAKAKTSDFWLYCTVTASSHTGYYTFHIKIDGQPTCHVYWREIDTVLKIRECKPPGIIAIKPSSRDGLGVVRFDLKARTFVDVLSGVEDRGRCKKIAAPTPK